MKLVIKNTGKKETVLEFSSAKTHDFLVKNAQDDFVWRWSDGRAFAQSFFSRALTSGQKMTFVSNWNQKIDQESPAPVGRYSVEAEFSALGQFTKLGPLYFELVD